MTQAVQDASTGQQQHIHSSSHTVFPALLLNPRQDYSPIMPNIAKVWFMALKASKACRPLRPTSVGNILLRCRNNLQDKGRPCTAFVGHKFAQDGEIS